MVTEDQKRFYDWLMKRQAQYEESTAKYKEAGEIELTCFYSGHAEAIEEIAKEFLKRFDG